MDKIKIFFIAAIVLIALLAGIAILKIGSEKQTLFEKNKILEEEKIKLVEDNRALQAKYNDTEARRRDATDKLTRIREELKRLEQAEKERDDYKTKYEQLKQERDTLAEEIKKKPMRIEAQQPSVSSAAAASQQVSDEYWADIVRAKAELEVKLESLSKELGDTKVKLDELDKTNRALTLKIDDLTKEKARLEQDMVYKEKTLSLVSRDLVNEREARRLAAEELDRIKAGNISLKRELVMANREKTQLQAGMKSLQEKKESLEKKIVEIESIFKEKSLALGELQNELGSAIKEGKVANIKEAGSVELPPIVVKSEASMLRGIKGSVIAVNQEEKFIVADLGDNSGLKPGAKMNILRGDKKIATAEVIETRKEISAAEIQEVASGFSIQEGDQVICQ